MNEETIVEAFFAKADEVTSNFYVYTEETLIEMSKDPRFRYDPLTKTLYIRVPLGQIKDESRNR